MGSFYQNGIVANLHDFSYGTSPKGNYTKLEIQVFLDQLGQNLPFIVENGAAIHNLDLVHPKFKFKNNSLVFSRSISEILELFEKSMPIDFQKRCLFLKDMKSIEQMKILGLNKKYFPFNYPSNSKFIFLSETLTTSSHPCGALWVALIIFLSFK